MTLIDQPLRQLSHKDFNIILLMRYLIIGTLKNFSHSHFFVTLCLSGRAFIHI